MLRMLLVMIAVVVTSEGISFGYPPDSLPEVLKYHVLYPSGVQGYPTVDAFWSDAGSDYVGFTGPLGEFTMSPDLSTGVLTWSFNGSATTQPWTAYVDPSGVAIGGATLSPVSQSWLGSDVVRWVRFFTLGMFTAFFVDVVWSTLRWVLRPVRESIDIFIG